MSQQIRVPDIGEFADVEVIEVSVQVGDSVAIEDPLITIETDKATVEVPAPASGVVQELMLKVGDKVSKDSLILTLSGADTKVDSPADVAPDQNTQIAAQPSIEQQEPVPAPTPTDSVSVKPGMHQRELAACIYASPGVRRFARELGVDLSKVQGTGNKNRILKQDIEQFVKQALSSTNVSAGQAQTMGANFMVAEMPEVDCSRFGEFEQQPLSRIKKLSGAYLHRNWVRIPHVTQFDEADITDLENFRKGQKAIAEKHGVKLTPLVFIMKAVVAGLKQFPHFNSQLTADGSSLILKKYFHIGVAVDTPNGLVVPVVRDVDQKGLFQLAADLKELSHKAREGKLVGADMQGGSFTISSLGGIGGTAFTPIVNAPEVAILGVSKSKQQPVFINGEFKPRLMVPLSLSYDHRVIDGADGVRFTSFLVQQLSDIRRLLL